MATVRKSAIVHASCERMFALVEACERYPEFLPWCETAEVISRSREVTEARLHIRFRGLRMTIGTRNLKRAPKAITLELLEGPFEHFHGEWAFAPLGREGCKVEFVLDYGFSARALETLLGPMFGQIAETLVESFVARAEALAAGGPP